MKHTTTDLKELLKKMRGDRSFEEFGNLYGVSRQLAFYWEAGRSVPRPDMLDRLGITVTYSKDIK